MTIGLRAARWGVKHPTLAARLARAIPLAGQVQRLGPTLWQVPSSKPGTYYVVRCHGPKRSSCPCVDSSRGNHCKHRLATALAWAEENAREVQDRDQDGQRRVRGPRAR